MRTLALTVAVFLVVLVAVQQASAVPLRGLASMDITADGQFIVITGRKDQSLMIIDVSTQP